MSISVVSAVVDALNTEVMRGVLHQRSNQVLQGCHWVTEILSWILRLMQTHRKPFYIGTLALRLQQHLLM